MSRLIWTPPAPADAQRLYRFLVSKDADAARRAVKAIRTGVKILAYRPRLGRPVGDMDADHREWPVDFDSSGYVALYRVEGETVAILAVRHQKERMGY